MYNSAKPIQKEHVEFSGKSVLLFRRTYIHTYIHAYIHTYIRTYVRTYIHTYMWVIEKEIVRWICYTYAYICIRRSRVHALTTPNPTWRVRGQGDLVSRLIRPIRNLVVPIIHPLTKPPLTPQVHRLACFFMEDSSRPSRVSSSSR